MDALKAFKRPKVWSETRMVNFEYDQLIRYIECSIWWESPNWVELLSRLYVLATYTLKIMLAKVQSTKLKTEYVVRVFQQESPDGLLAMKTAVRLGEALLLKSDQSIVNEIISTFPDIIVTTTDSSDNKFIKEVQKWLKKYSHIYNLDHLSVPITRRESQTSCERLVMMVNSFIDHLWDGIKSRFPHCDMEGRSCWSEAPAESIFSVYKMAMTGRQSLTVDNTVSLCRLFYNGPKAATAAGEDLINKAAEKWKAKKGMQFQTEHWQIRFVSKLISQLKSGAEVAEEDNDPGDLE